MKEKSDRTNKMLVRLGLYFVIKYRFKVNIFLSLISRNTGKRCFEKRYKEGV